MTCGSAKAEPQRVRCKLCLKQNSACTRRQYKKRRKLILEKAAERRSELKAAGLCVNCKNKAVDGRSRCAPCIILERNRMRNTRSKLREHETV